ncbi:MAG: hypothetical protein JWO88_1592, partial [Frankiales bacterium]|nr:hypothetical protein [Frankiales bacterium]
MSVALIAIVPCLSYIAPTAGATPRTATRTVQATYSQPGGLVLTTGQPVLISPGVAHPSKSPENQARITVTDRSGRAVAIDVEYQPRGATGPTSSIYCGASPTLGIAVGSSVRVTPLAGTCPNGSPSLPTSGTIAVAFTRPLPPPGIAPEQRWALLVGIQDYAGNTHSTYGARGDVSAARTALLRSGWRSDHIRTLVDGQASGQAI